MFNPWKQEIKFIQAVNRVVSRVPGSLYVFRTVDGKVVRREIALMGLNFETGQITVEFRIPGQEITLQEQASEQDLKLISVQAQQKAQALRS